MPPVALMARMRTDTLDTVRPPRGLPDPRPRGERASVRLPRLRARPRRSPARCSTPSATFAERYTSAVHRGAHTVAGEATELFEDARATRRRASSARAATRSSGPPTPPRASTSSPTGCRTRSLGRGGAAAERFRLGAGRRDRRHRGGAPRQPHPVAGARRAHRRDPARASACTTTARCASTRPPSSSARAPSVVAFTHVSNVLGAINPVAELVALAHGSRRARRARRLPVGAAPAARPARRSTSTSPCSPATRCSARPASACSTAAASC